MVEGASSVNASMEAPSHPEPPLSMLPSSTPTVALTQNVQKTVLDNGLTVLTKELHTAPVVSVQVWYRVGSRNECSGLNGISHLLEHLMFKGTRDRPIQFGRLFSALGSQFNAFTSYDQTAYYGTVERDKLKALLLLEADRMTNALINPEQLSSEKRVVISELQGYENDPSYRLERAVRQVAFPQAAYGLPVGGLETDVAGFTVEQVRDYYQHFYSPNNATLVIVGDFDTEPTLQAVKAAFGSIPQSQTADSPAPLEPQAAIAPSHPTPQKMPIVLREPGSAALLHAVYSLPNVSHPDVPALHVLDFILTGGRSSRLYQALVESGLASDISGYAANMIGAGWYDLSVTAASGQKLTKIDQVVQRSLANLRDRPVSAAELQRAKTQLRAALVLRNREVTSQAMQLADDQSSTGDFRYSDRLLAAIAQVSATDVQRVAQTYLKPEQRTVGFFEPTQLQAGTTKTGSSTQTSENFSPGEPVSPAEVEQYLPAIDSSTTPAALHLPEQFTLPNGLTILLLPDSSTPTVTLSGHLKAGTEFDPNDRAGLADLTAENLMNGTKTKTALALAESLENRGADLTFEANREGVLIDGAGLAQDLPLLVQTLADVLQNATFPARDVELSRQRALTDLEELLDDPRALGRRVFQQAIYPETHPFHSFSTAESLRQITRADLVQFYHTHYRPDATVLTLVGDFDPAEVRSLLTQAFGNWSAPEPAPSLSFPQVSLPTTTRRLQAKLPGKAQSVTYLGYQGIDRQDPRYYAALVLNEILGGDTLSSRLGVEIRDRQGLTYGIYSYFQAGSEPGPFLISMQHSPEDTEQAIASTVALLQQMRSQGVTAAEVAAAKQSLASGYPVELADPDSLADQILMNAVYGLKRAELREFADKVQAVTVEQVNQAIQELLHPDHLVIVTAGAPSPSPR